MQRDECEGKQALLASLPRWKKDVNSSLVLELVLVLFYYTKNFLPLRFNMMGHTDNR